MRESCGGKAGKVTARSRREVEARLPYYAMLKNMDKSPAYEMLYPPIDAFEYSYVQLLDVAMFHIFRFLLDNYGEDFSLTEIALGVGFPRSLASDAVLTPGHGDKVIKKTRQVGSVSYYALKASRATWGELELILRSRYIPGRVVSRGGNPSGLPRWRRVKIH